MKPDKNCTLCKLHQSTDNVCLLGQGDHPSEVMIIGEAPNASYEAGNDAFGGRAGSLLKEAIEDVGIELEDVYVTHAVSCRPPENRSPSKAEIKACAAWVRYQVKHVKPRFVLLLGNAALQSITGAPGIKKMRGKPFEKDGVVYLPTWHPNFVLHDDRQLPILQNDLKLFKRIIEFGGIPRERELDYRIVDSRRVFNAMLRDLKGTVAIDLETTRLYPFTTELDLKVERGEASKHEQARHKKAHGEKQPAGSTAWKMPKVVSIQFATAKHQWVLPAEAAGVFNPDEFADMLEELTDKLEDCYTVYHNGKFDALWMWVRYGVRWHVDFDTMLAHYMIDENSRHGLKELAQLYYGAPDWDVDVSTKTTWSNRNAKYAAHDVFYTRKLRFTLGKLLHEDGLVKRVFDKIMMPCVGLFVEAEYDGIFIDKSKMDDAEEYLREEHAKAKAELDEYGFPDWADPKTGVNWGSPQQVGKLFFDTLKLKPLDKTKGGGNSVSESVLMRLDHPCAGALLKWRAADKQLNAFIEGWKPFIDLNGYLHPSFKLHGTVTGRLSCERPNLQQVPRDKRIRSLIYAPLGWHLLEVDLSQIELRITAELSSDPAMLHAFRTGVDIHWLTAIKEIARGAGMKEEVIETAYRYAQKKMSYAESIETLLVMGPDIAAELMEEWKELRKKAKAINFGYVFGMWWKKFKIYARDNYGVILDDRQAQESRISFFETYTKLDKWHDRQRRFARMNGYVRSLSGRKRRLPDAQSPKDTPERAEALRQAINSPVQSFANELNLMAALQLRSEYGRNVVKLCGTVHDACLLRVREDKVVEVHDRMLEIMRGPDLLKEFEIELNVPIEADAKIGPWGSGVKVSKWQENLKQAA